jgi:hypothetical protein
MTRAEIFDAWAPADGKWSLWAKPVLFAHMPQPIEAPGTVAEPIDASWLARPDGQTAIVADLPGAQGVHFGLASAALGYRPVPLYNAAPGPMPVVTVSDILLALQTEAARLIEFHLPAEAPPVFLLDSNRRVGTPPFEPGMFDNRSVSFPSDFPSANFLLSLGITRIRLVMGQSLEPQADLAHTLRRWQESGIEFSAQTIGHPDAVFPITIERPSGFRRLWHAALVAVGLRRNPLGGFGGIVPTPGGHGG